MFFLFFIPILVIGYRVEVFPSDCLHICLLIFTYKGVDPPILIHYRKIAKTF